MPPSNRLRRQALSLLLGLLSLSGTAWAEFLWIDPAGPTPRAFLGELDGERADPSTLKAPRRFDEHDRPVPMEVRDSALPLPAADTDLRVTAFHVPEPDQLEYFHARSGRRETRALGDLELVPVRAGGRRFRLMWKGTPVAASVVNVWTSAGWHKVLRGDADGTVEVDTPFAGLYVLEVSAQIAGRVTVDGVDYARVRHTATLSFRLDAP